MFRLKKLPANMNAHQLHLKSGVTYATVLQYMNTPETVKSVDLKTLYRIMRALDMDLSELRFLDVFTED
jgi:DNA-binding Xre family transcriptional regulator